MGTVLYLASQENMEILVKCWMHAGHCAAGTCIDYFIGSSQQPCKICYCSHIVDEGADIQRN